MKVLYIFKSGRSSRSLQTESFPKDFFYGFFDLPLYGFEVDMLEDHQWVRSYGSKGGRIQRLLRRVLGWGGLNADFLIFLLGVKGRKEVNAYDRLIVSVHSFGLTLSFCKILGLIKPEVCFIVMGLIDKKSSWIRTQWIRWLVKRSILVAISHPEAGFLTHKFKRKVPFVPFGIDIDYWTPAEDFQSGEYFLSIGNDSHRDYHTLLNAWDSRMPKLKIITNLVIPPAWMAEKSNVEIIKSDWSTAGVSDSQMRDLIRESRAVVIPLKDTMQPSGQSVCLQAMACARPVIISHNCGFWGEGYLKHKEHCYWVSCGQPEEITSAVKWIESSTLQAQQMGNQGQKTVQQYFTRSSMAQELTIVLR